MREKSLPDSKGYSKKSKRRFVMSTVGLFAHCLLLPASLANPAGTHTGGTSHEVAQRGFSTVTPFRAPDPGVPVEIPASNSNSASSSVHVVSPMPVTIQPAASTTVLNQALVNNGAIAPTDAVRSGASMQHASMLQKAPFLNPTLPENAMLNTSSAGISDKPASTQAQQLLVSRIDSSIKTLPEGNSLLRSETDMTIQTAFGALRIAAKSTVLCALTRRSISIYTLHDAPKGKVEIEVNGKHLRIAQGVQLTLTNDLRSSFAEINPLCAIKHKELRTHSFKNDIVAFVGVYSISSAIMSIEILKQDANLQKAADTQQITYGSF